MNDNNKEKGKTKDPVKGGGIGRHFTKRQKDPNFVLSVFVTTVKLFIIFVLIAGFAGFGALLGVARAYVDGTPVLDVQRITDQDLTSFIYAANGDLITEFKGLEHRIPATLDEIPQSLQDAIIATEDVRFYAHNGLDYKRLFGAFVNNLRSESVQGGSTLTQQLIKNTMLTPEQTYKRKIQEAYLALQLEKEYSKEDILTAYLNAIYLGSGNYGVKAAAENYFGKDLADLNLRESAVLAGITQNPSRFDPRANLYRRQQPEVTFRRANLVLRLMYENGSITKRQYDDALFDLDGDESINGDFYVLEESNHQKLYDMPYFVEYVIEDVIKALRDDRGWDRGTALHYIQTAGLHIYTTVDQEIQKSVENAVYNYDNYPDTRDANHRFTRERVGERIVDTVQPQAGAVVIDHTTGQIKALVGGRQEPEVRMSLDRLRAGWRPGSSIKPLAAFASFIEKGYPGGPIIEDIPYFEGWEGGQYPYPRNYDSRTFDGPVSIVEVASRSLNNPTARIVQRVGVEYSENKLKEMGMTDVVANLSSFSLGSGNVKMVEVTGAYAALANKGTFIEPISFTKVLDKDGKVVYDNESRQTRLTVYKESTTYILTEELLSAALRGTGSRANFSGMNVVGKTGTNDEQRGVFFAGFTPYYTAAVFISHDNHHPLKASGSVTGGSHAAPLWRRVMEPIHQELANKPFYDSVPSGVERVTVCALSGKLPTAQCEDRVTLYFPPGAKPTERCDWHVEMEICRYSGKLLSPFCPEDHRATRGVLVLPEDSLYQNLSDSELSSLRKFKDKAFFKTAVDISRLQYSNPDHRNYFCPLHTREWQEAESRRAPLTEEALQLIDQVKVNMNMYKQLLTNNQIKTLNDAIDKLNEALNTGITTPGEGDSYVDEITYFKPEAVTKEMDNLVKLFHSIFDSLSQPTPSPSPTPSNPPASSPADPTPTPEPES